MYLFKQGGRGLWKLLNKSLKFYNKVLKFVGLTALVTFILLLLVGSLSQVFY